MPLTDGQQRAFDAFLRGESIVITGPAGCGKSYLIEKIEEEIHGEYAITAMTGAAASLLGGNTLHGWGGLPFDFVSPEQTADFIRRKRKKAHAQWKNVDVLIIDEISMMNKQLFNILDHTARILRRSESQFFGGIQLVLCGDFCQLPPVEKDKKREDIEFCFESKSWVENLGYNTYHLTEVKRQDDDEFKEMLMRIRMGEWKKSDKTLLDSRVRPQLEEDMNIIVDLDGREVHIEPTFLYPTNKDVSKINMMHLEKLQKKTGVELATFTAKDSVEAKKKNRVVAMTREGINFINKCSRVEEKLEICVGAQVMLLKNINVDEGLVNGSRGVVEAYDEEAKTITVVFHEGSVITLTPEEFEINGGDVLYKRLQFPIKLAWAITIHKSQGMTIPNVYTDLTQAFDPAQIYVTLSRVRSIDDLFLSKPVPFRKIGCHPKVLGYYDSLAA